MSLDNVFFETGRKDGGINERINERIKDLSETEKKVYLLLHERSESTQTIIADKLNFSEKYVRKVIKNLKDKQFIKRIGSSKNGYWEVFEF